jgi:hypothetical protein
MFSPPFFFLDSLSSDPPDFKVSADQVVVRIMESKKEVNYTKVGFYMLFFL